MSSLPPLTTGRIEVVDRNGHLRSCPSSLGGVDGDRRSRRYDSLAGTRRIRETKWKGSRAREGNSYKLWYSGSSTARKGVGIILAGSLKDNVVRVTRRSDRIMAISVDIDRETVNIISAYALQVGLSEAEKRGAGTLWTSLLVILDVLFETQRHKRKASGRPRILWKNLNGETVKAFRATVTEKLATLEEDMSASNAKQLYNTLACAIKDAAKDSLGVASESARTHSMHKESWEDDIKKRWGEYFSSLFNETLAEESRPEGSEEVRSSGPHMHYDCYYSRINQGEARAALHKMGRNKAIFQSAKMSDEWRLSEVIPIYKNKGDVQACSNYRGIKLLSHSMKLWERLIERRGIQENIPWCMIFADDIVLITESTKGLNNRLESWRKALEDNGLRVSREKTKYLRCDFGRYEVVHQEEDIRIGDQILQPKESFRYLGFLCDKRIPSKLKGNFYRVAIRPAMLYGSECWPITKAQANRVEVAELRMLRWPCGKTMVDMIPNGVFRSELGVDSIFDKMREGRLRWFGYVKKRPQNALVRRVEALLVEGTRRRCRPKLRWEDRLKLDMKELILSEE
ncbi:retrovirus-related pol polyprotein LINE-1 [Tanacetum coccineum]